MSGRRRRVAVVFGVPVDDVTMDETIAAVVELVADGRRRGRTHQIATTNADFLVNADHDAALRAVLQRASLSMPDGMPVVWGSRLLGRPLRTRVAGADLVPALAARLAATGGSLYFLGAAPGVADDAARRLMELHPGVRITADPGPVFRTVDEIDPAALAPIRAADPDVLCVAFGNPKQEWFIDRFGAALGVPVAIGVGGTLDFIVGEQRRAPVWMQRVGLEWLFRMLQDPRRLVKRYARDFVVFGSRLARQVWELRRRAAGPAAPPIVDITGSSATVRVVGSLRDQLDPWPAHLFGWLDGSSSVDVDVTALPRLDTPTVSALAELVLAARDAGAGIDVRFSDHARRHAGVVRLDEIFTASPHGGAGDSTGVGH